MTVNSLQIDPRTLLNCLFAHDKKKIHPLLEAKCVRGGSVSGPSLGLAADTGHWPAPGLGTVLCGPIGEER